MKIGIVTTWFDRGAAFVSKQFADTLSNNNRVYIFARGGESYDKSSSYWKQYPVTWSKRYAGGSTRINWPQFKNWVKDNNIDIVLFNEQQDWEIVVDAKKLNIKTVAYIDYYTQETIPFFNIYDAVICNTKRHREALNGHPNAYYVPWGTDTDIFKPKKENTTSLSTPVFFHSAGMGGINLRKGTDILVESFSHVKSDKAQLIIHSQSPIKSYQSIRKIIENDSRIQFIEKTVSPPGLYHLGNVYVYPSKLEGIGLTICEALACGLPTITTNTQPMNEFVEHSKTGVLVDVERNIARADGYYWPESICSKSSLTKAMQFFVDHPEKIQEYSANAVETSLNQFNWAKNASCLNDIFLDICKSKPIVINNFLNLRALGYSFEKREKRWSIWEKVKRKIDRLYHQL